jgi:transmembrane sensor
MDERIYMIIAKELAGEAEEAELVELRAWLSSAEGNRQEYEHVKALWGQADEVMDTPVFNTTAAWNKVAGKISQPQVAKPKTIQMPAWTKYAAGMAAVLLLSLLLWKPLSGDGSITVLADNGNMEVILPDNSHITLREGSTLKYPEKFDPAQRNVELDGEAFFEVTHNEQQPFVIHAGAANVRVLGTSFNVHCTADEAEVTVTTGKVQMTSHTKKEDYVILTPGEKGVLVHNELAEMSVNDDNYLYWKTGILAFENKPLGHIVAEIAKVHKTNIMLDNAMPEAVKAQVITISFNRQPIEEMLTELCLVAKCRWAKSGEGYTISAQ